MAAPRPITIALKQFRFVVRPQPFRVSETYGEAPAFELENTTPFDLDIDFLLADLVKDANNKPVQQLKVKKGTTAKGYVVNTALAYGSYPYKVAIDLGVALEAPLEAEGGSRPEVEIRR